MTRLIILPSVSPVVAPDRCGNCYYSEKIGNDPTMVLCKGGPPTPVILGMGQDALGRPVPQVQSFWGSLPSSSRRCALWAPIGAAPGEKVQ